MLSDQPTMSDLDQAVILASGESISSLATSLTVRATKDGARVVLLDVDPQEGHTMWQGPHGEPDIPLEDVAAMRGADRLAILARDSAWLKAAMAKMRANAASVAARFTPGVCFFCATPITHEDPGGVGRPDWAGHIFTERRWAHHRCMNELSVAVPAPRVLAILQESWGSAAADWGAQP